MARMLGRFETPGCCPGMKAGWRRRRRRIGPDCYGAGTDTRWRKRVEQREFARSLVPEEPLPVAAAYERDCRHGCDGECLLYGGPHDCGYTCHPGALAGRLA